MADVVVSEGTGGEGDLTASSLHDAAVAEGKAELHEVQAAEHAATAEVAAELAGAAAQANASVVEEIQSSVAVASSAAQEASLSRDAVMEALAAQTAAFNTLAEELRAQAKAATAPLGEKSTTSTTDKPPAKKKSLGHKYYGR